MLSRNLKFKSIVINFNNVVIHATKIWKLLTPGK